MRIVGSKELREFVETSLYDDQSPENISGRLKHEPHLFKVSKDSIYRFINSVYGRKIEIHRSKKRQRNYRRSPSTKKLADRVFIDKRPHYIDSRQRIGDTESDFIVSGKSGHGILLTLVDRKIRACFIELILEINIKSVHQAFLNIKERFPEMKSITTDNDILLRHHKELEKLLKVRIYFCHPYHSWEKGTVENTNKYIRRDILKGSDISHYSKKFISSIESKLNRRYMKCLDHISPKEALESYRTKQKKRIKR